MDRFLLNYFVCVGLIGLAGSQHLPVPDLPYDYDALEPFVDEATMRVHHLGHHAAYTSKLNMALSELRADENTKHLAKMGIDRLIQKLSDLPEDFRDRIRSNGGGYLNHELFFNSLAKPSTEGGKGGGPPSGNLSKKITEIFGSFQFFKSQFSSVAGGVFGSGYAWLVYDVSDDSLSIVPTQNQDTPASDPTKVPLLVIDVWEHAYYLKHQNIRGNWISSFWELVNWDVVEERYTHAQRRNRKEL